MDTVPQQGILLDFGTEGAIVWQAIEVLGDLLAEHTLTAGQVDYPSIVISFVHEEQDTGDQKNGEQCRYNEARYNGLSNIIERYLFVADKDFSYHMGNFLTGKSRVKYKRKFLRFRALNGSVKWEVTVVAMFLKGMDYVILNGPIHRLYQSS